MTYSEVNGIVAEMGFPYAYYQFNRKTAKAPPFICFYYPGSDDFIADDANYVGIRQTIVELYTKEKDFTAEKTVEDTLKKYELPYRKTETYIDTEKMYMVAYYTEVIINE